MVIILAFLSLQTLLRVPSFPSEAVPCGWVAETRPVHPGRMAECVSKDDHAKGAMCLSPVPPHLPPPSFPPWTFLELWDERQSRKGPIHGGSGPQAVCGH